MTSKHVRHLNTNSHHGPLSELVHTIKLLNPQWARVYVTPLLTLFIAANFTFAASLYEWASEIWHEWDLMSISCHFIRSCYYYQGKKRNEWMCICVLSLLKSFKLSVYHSGPDWKISSWFPDDEAWGFGYSEAVCTNWKFIVVPKDQARKQSEELAS